MRRDFKGGTLMEVTVEITDYCPNKCAYCSTRASTKGTPIDKQKVFDFINNRRDITRINISGGEPLSHPDFYEILVYCNEICEDVRVYTNAIKHIMFNADILDKVTVSANVCLIPGTQNFIPDVENIHLLKPVKQGNLKKGFKNKITLSHSNCTNCGHEILQRDGKITKPCKKEYV
jgi:hypothetical protein